MKEKMQFTPRAQLLTLEELALLGRTFVELGVTKLRITGGEPLVRKNILELFEYLGQLAGLKELVVTTNGSQLEKTAKPLKAAGVKRVNISLDSLQAERFKQITRTGNLDMVLRGIKAAIAAGFDKVKLNVVVLKHRNHDEVCDLVKFSVDHGIDVSFIEEMPIGLINSHDRHQGFYSSQQIRQDLEQVFNLLPTMESTDGPARYYYVAGTHTRVGFISPHSHNFCDTCNRVRVTTEGRLLLCLGQENSVDLRRVIRAHPGDSLPLKQAIVAAMIAKPKGHDFNLEKQFPVLRHMNMTGG
jgi:cyclic pyranopterin phosphate synthase